MATKSFLSAEELEVGEREKLTAPRAPPSGDETTIGELQSAREFSAWLGERLHEKLRSHRNWEASRPIALGSWARGELSARSDIDLLFTGDEARVLELVQDFSRAGLKLRYRMPADPADWTQGVEPFDILALLSAVPLVDSARAPLHDQLSTLDRRIKSFRRDLSRAMRVERSARAKRYDSISNFLEPNLKYGPGGLRDLQQALSARLLYPERFVSHEHSLAVLDYYKSFFLLVRHKLHLAGTAADVLAAPEQRPISEWFGFKDNRDFMREIQKGLARVSFYADWTIEQALQSNKRISEVDSRKLTQPSHLFSALEEDPSLLMQNRVRLVADEIFAKSSGSGDLDRKRGQAVARFISPERAEEPLVAFFRSRLIDHCVPELRSVVGYVQHDQYHRFSVDAHLLQALRGLKRLQRRPKIAGKLAPVVRSLSRREWEILSFACLYHDIAKGRGGDHSIDGSQVAEHDLSTFGFDSSFIAEVRWIIEQHLTLSFAAFRENPHSPRTWTALGEKGVKGRRLALLATFTVVDIIATNPEAWTPWKETLLAKLVEQLEKPETGSILKLGESLKAAGFAGWQQFLDNLDPYLASSLPTKTLADDVKSLVRGTAPEVVVKKLRGGKQNWVRFHAAEDRPGLFLDYVKRLAAAGLGVRHASIHTEPGLGVYDWFEVKTTKSPAQVQKLLQVAARAGSSTYNVRFDSVELAAAGDEEWVIGFRGKDQSGALAGAAQALFDEGVEIRWAKVHTWGRQIDDVFGVRPLSGPASELINRLAKRLCPGS